VLRGRPPTCELLFPIATCPLYPVPCSRCEKSTVELGLELLGVADGVPLGVDDALSPPARDFRDDERGVMLLLRKALTGVTFSGAAAATLGVVPTLLRVVRVLWELTVEEAVGATASRGVKGVFAVRLLASVGFSGRGLLRSGRSMGILHGVRLL
jgi:hypothetical protein